MMKNLRKILGTAAMLMATVALFAAAAPTAEAYQRPTNELSSGDVEPQTAEVTFTCNSSSEDQPCEDFASGCEALGGGGSSEPGGGETCSWPDQQTIDPTKLVQFATRTPSPQMVSPLAGVVTALIVKKITPHVPNDGIDGFQDEDPPMG